ncbi:inositol monophosphatase family protein [Krasilnikovia sp. MM14-A1259]|uniref:inositol monophosphatase family protein n=1 Tax=Krasilnikovia sp. MM14-A1259 TaxID=3373539 RepID=UPI0038177C36
MIDDVTALVREVARTLVLPRFRHLDAADVREKAPGDVVTVADAEAERALTAGLTALLPGSAVVGEEAVAADPRVRDRIGDEGAVWVVDPVDGTANFAAGRTPFAMMVALLQGGETAAAWILDVPGDRMVVAERGSGAYLDGVRIPANTGVPARGTLTGSVPTRYLPEELRHEVDARGPELGTVTSGKHCAGYEYPAVATGAQQFALFWHVMPWDHVPGALIVRESGGTVRHFDGSEYRPASGGPGLVVAGNADIWDLVHATLVVTGH